MRANDALINNRRVLHSSSAGDLVPYLPSSVRATLLVGRALPPRLVVVSYPDQYDVTIIAVNSIQVNQKLLYRESDWWDVGLVVHKARKQGTVC